MERGTYRKGHPPKRPPVTDQEIQELIAFIGDHGRSPKMAVYEPLFQTTRIRKAVNRIQNLAAGMLRIRPHA